MYIAIQPIVNLRTRERKAYEILCRPQEGLSKYFRVSTPKELWEREKKCLELAVQAASIFPVPAHINLAASSLPFFLDSGISWVGSVEIVEWGFSFPDGIQDMILELKRRGFGVWIDDVSPIYLKFWGTIPGVDGLKLNFRDLVFLDDLFSVFPNIGLIVEKIETQEELEEVKNMGVVYGQGFALGAPLPLHARIRT